MKSWEFDAVVYDGEIYCVECLPEEARIKEDEAWPIFADSEWDHYPICDNCGMEHKYVGLTDYGRFSRPIIRLNNNRKENKK